MTACVRGRIEFDEKVSADASHKKFSDKKLPESRAKKKNGRAWRIQRLSDVKTADTARSSKGRIAEVQTALSELAASQVAMTEDGIDSKCFALVVLRDYCGGEDKAQESLDGSR